MKNLCENGHNFSLELFLLFIFAPDLYLNMMNGSPDHLNHMKFHFKPRELLILDQMDNVFLLISFYVGREYS